MMRAMLVLVLAWGLAGCCTFCKRRVRPPVEIVHVSKPCLSSYPPLIGRLMRDAASCANDLSCYDAANALKLANWIEAAAIWMRDAVTLCGKPQEEVDNATNPDT